MDNKDDNACCHCKKVETDFDEDHKLQVCTKCKGVGRVVKYCSRDCQLQDWKNGHKSLCGQNSELEERIPIPDPAFTRSAALLNQIAFLKRPPYVDYVFTAPPPHDDQGFSCPLPRDKLQFLVMRRRAMYNCDPAAVRAMFQLLVNTVPAAPGITISSFKQQLQDEYGVDIDSIGDVGVAPPTEAELEIAFKFMKNRR